CGCHHATSLMGKFVRAVMSALSGLHASHANRAVEDLDLFESVLSKPAEDLRIEKLPLVSRRVPIERVEPAPAPVRQHRDGEQQIEQLADHWKAVDVVERNGERRNDAHDSERESRCNLPRQIRKSVREAVSVVKVNGQPSTDLDICGKAIERRARVGGVMEHSDRVRQVKRTLAKGEREDVGLREVNVWKPADVEIRGVDGARDVHSENLGIFSRHAFRESARSYTRIEHQSAGIIALLPSGRGQKGPLRLARAIHRIELNLSEPRPLPSEARGI